jgi:pyruvate kinase
MRGNYTQTKIGATAGPATETSARLRQLNVSGVDVIRPELEHGTVEWVAARVRRIREASRDGERHVAVMMDVKGPEIRTDAAAESVKLKPDDKFEFHTPKPTEGGRGVDVKTPGSAAGTTSPVDSEPIRPEVFEKDATHLRCRMITPRKPGSRRRRDLPGVDWNFPALAEKDERGIRLGATSGINLRNPRFPSPHVTLIPPPFQQSFDQTNQ